MTPVTFSGKDGRLGFEVSGYERPTASDLYDANWLNATVSVAAGPFHGSFKLSLTTWGFSKLREQLAEVVEGLSGRVDFASTEGDVIFSVEFSHRGTATVFGCLKPNGSERIRLNFSFETDQSFLSETIQQLDDLVARLPVREVQ